MSTEKITLGTKAETLKRLSDVVKGAVVLPLHYFDVASWRADSDGIVAEIMSYEWADGAMIVRSSGVSEDSSMESLAGYYDSVLGVVGEDGLRSAIDRVIDSFGGGAELRDQVLVQPMLKNVLRSGVAFTTDAATSAPYRVIEWSDGEDTTAVTSGKETRTFYQATTSPYQGPQELQPVIELLDELERIIPDTPLDIEFAITADQVYLLQVRTLVLTREVMSGTELNSILNKISERARRGFRPHPFLHGKRTVYGVMPDWNPAEIIGTRPRPLAFSLYRELITNATWAYQRNNYGYKNLRSHPLLIDFMGQPYVDVRVSFNSFIPRDIDSDLSDRLVDHYLDRLESNPHFHDKVEFDIVYTCYTFDIKERMTRLLDHGFSAADCEVLTSSLRNLTNKVINAKSGLWVGDAERVQTLAERRSRLYQADTDHVTKIYWLLEDCKRYGTLPFAGLARAGFISVSLLRSLVSLGVLTQADSDRFINSLDAVSSQLPRDLFQMNKIDFLEKYGHLRPGTYDILSNRYDATPELYFDWERVSDKQLHSKHEFKLTLDQMKSIEQLLREHGLENDVIGFLEFLKAGIELRESSKFEFTRNLSDALELIAEYGQIHGFTREEMSFANIDAFYELYRSSVNPRQILEQSIETGKGAYERTCKVNLPPLITKEEDIWQFELPETEPNFITQQRVVAEVCKASQNDDLKGKIVCIPSADPGYDWLFSHEIAGLITCFGGANSHMAIRANELGLPAVIGAGEAKFSAWASARRLDVDCANCKVEVLA